MTNKIKKLFVIHNPVSGSRNKARMTKALKLLERAGCAVTIATTQRAGHAEDLAAEATTGNQEWSAIVAAGGDGTISEVANGLRGRSVPLGVIPLGTANVFAREIGIGTRLRTVVSVLSNASPVPIYPGLIGRRRFLLMVGAGYDSLAVSGLDPVEKKKYGAVAYLLSAYRSARQFKHLDISVKIGGQEIKGASVIVSRSRLFGGPFTLAPQADLRKPDLHILVLRNKGVWAAVQYGIALASNRIWTLRSVDYFQTEEVVEINATENTPCQCDGDGGYFAPLVVSLDDQSLNILAAYPPTS